MAPESSNADYWQITSTAIPEIESVRLYKDTVEHIKERHPEVVQTVGVEGVRQTVRTPTQVFPSKTDPQAFVFSTNSVQLEGDSVFLHIPVKKVTGTSGRVATAYLSNRDYSSDPIWKRDDPQVNYDEDSDVLYITTRSGEHGVAEESLPGVLWRYAPHDGDIVGVTIMDFSFYWASRLDDLARDLADHLNISAGKASSLLQFDHMNQ